MVKRKPGHAGCSHGAARDEWEPHVRKWLAQTVDPVQPNAMKLDPAQDCAMQFDRESCCQALASRDARFDGVLPASSSAGTASYFRAHTRCGRLR